MNLPLPGPRGRARPLPFFLGNLVTNGKLFEFEEYQNYHHFWGTRPHVKGRHPVWDRKLMALLYYCPNP